MTHKVKIHRDWHATLLSYLKLGIIIIFEIGLEVYMILLREFINTPTKITSISPQLENTCNLPLHSFTDAFNSPNLFIITKQGLISSKPRSPIKCPFQVKNCLSNHMFFPFFYNFKVLPNNHY